MCLNVIHTYVHTYTHILYIHTLQLRGGREEYAVSGYSAPHRAGPRGGRERLCRE